MKKLDQARGMTRAGATRLCAVAALLLSAGIVQAGHVPENLGAGLREIAAKRMSALNPSSALARQRARGAAANQMLTIEDSPVVRDGAGRVLVNVVVHGQHQYDAVRAAVAGVSGMKIVAEDRKYRAGIIEGFVPEESVVALAKLRGVSAVHAVNLPGRDVGTVTQQGVVQHRVNLLPANLDGTGISIGVLSDSYNTAANFITGGAPLTIRAANDIASCDLPGAGNPCGNTQPVVVLQDFGTFPNTQVFDEGRGMLQLIHDMAPKARLAFASASIGDVTFANNIRALAGIQGLPNSHPDFVAQVIVDDVQYFNEGMFSDTIIAQAVDDVTALGVSYFSSANNTPPTQGYASDFRFVPVGPNATAGTNINLANVPTSLYGGGFHNFRGDGSQDIAQTLNLGTGRQLRMTMQWDDPYDVTPTTVGPVIAQFTGTLTTPTSQVDGTFTAIAGHQYQVDVHGDSTTGGPGNLDVVVDIIQPDGSLLEEIDTGTAELFSFFAPQSGVYTVRVKGFAGDTGPFVAAISEGTGVAKVTSDFNLLFFRVDTGAYLGCICENNLATNRPVELPGTLTFPTTAPTQVQLVISRATIPNTPTPASRLRYKMLASSNGSTGAPAEYFSYVTPVTYGHNSAAGANSVAAYSPFRPNIPEDFTSTGPVRIVWDRNNNRIPDDQQIRLKPDIAAMDGGNTTFFTSDTNRDIDTFPNFFGTSAAAPTAASIAALVLQNKGGPGSVTPAQMKTILQRSAFPHDLDPYMSKSAALAVPNRGKVSISLEGDNSALARVDPNAFTIAYSGTSSITSITFDGTNGNPGGGNVTESSTPGLVFDTRATVGQPFVVGSGSVGLTPGDVVATTLNQAPAPAVAGEFFQLKLDFTPGAFTGGKVLRFGIGRAYFRSPFAPPAGDSRAGNSGDLAGAVIRLPEGSLASGGVTFSGTLADGSTFSGALTNRIGTGWSALDGFGFINAQSAVNQPLP